MTIPEFQIARALRVSDSTVVACLPMVRSIARRLRQANAVPRHITDDDLLSAGTSGLMEARGRFSSQHGATFKTFAHYRVRGAMVDYMRSIAPASRSAYEAIRRGEGDQRRRYAVQLDHLKHPEQIAAVAPDVSEERVIGSRLSHALGALDVRDRYIIDRYFFYNDTLRCIGRAINVNESRAGQLLTRAIFRVRVAIGIVPPPKRKRRVYSRRTTDRYLMRVAPHAMSPTDEPPLLRSKHYLRGEVDA